MSTYSTGTVHSLNSYIVNGSTSLSASTASSLIFQVDSTANIITKLSGFTWTSADVFLCIGPTNGASPSATNGTIAISAVGTSLGVDSFVHLGGANAALAPTTPYTATAGGEVSEGAALAQISDLILPPGYFVYMYNTNAGSSRNYSYQLHEIKISQT